MISATDNGIVFSGLTTDEMLALANSTAQKFAPAPVECKADVVVTRKASSQRAIIATVCGHPIARKGAGRPPRYCEQCSAPKSPTVAQAKPQSGSRKWTGRKATTDIEKVRAQVIRYAAFARKNNLISVNDADAAISLARTSQKLGALIGVKSVLSRMISDANLWADYMAQRKNA